MNKPREKIIPINIEDEMKSSYIDYSMSVIVSRALPDVRDGLKPVHRRVLFGMYQLGILSNKPHKKSARIVGEVLGKYHPHGDSSVYDAMVRMAQDWSLRYELIDGQGNFGSIDGDPPAAMRYTEVRLKKIAEEILTNIDKDTVKFQLNFDDTLQEPTVMPTRIPNLLINGSSGIAVGMATNMAPHNLSESINAICAFIDNPNINISELIKHIKAPDFATGGIIYGYKGVEDSYKTGKGKIILRAKTSVEKIDERECIIVHEIPYQVNKADMLSRTAELIKEGKIDGIFDIRDESDRNGMRIVYYLKNNTIPNIILNKLYKNTSLQTSFSVNNIALVNGRPIQLNLKEIIFHFVKHRHDIILKRSEYELKKAKEKKHIIDGLLIALNHLDQIIMLIQKSDNTDKARKNLIHQFKFSDIQSRSILDMKLRTINKLEKDKIHEEYQQLNNSVKYLEKILIDESLQYKIIKNELIEIKNKYGDERRTKINFSGKEISLEDLIPNEKVVVTISYLGYIKRTPLTVYKKQSRGGIGNKAASTRTEDFLDYIIIANNHQYILFFTEKGKCYWLRVFEIPEGNKISKGRAIQNLIKIEQNDRVRAYIKTYDLKNEEYINNTYLTIVTKQGIIKKTKLKFYSQPRIKGINAINIKKTDTLVAARLTTGKNDIIIATKNGKAIRFPENKVRPMGRNTSGVKGISLQEVDDEVIGFIIINNIKHNNVLVVSKNGYGKRTKVSSYRITNRGGKGIITLNITKKTGHLIAIQIVNESNDLMIINKSGVAIRMAVSEMRLIGRNTQGVRLINLKKGDEIASITKIDTKVSTN